MKKQIWFRPDQCDLVTTCLKQYQFLLNNTTAFYYTNTQKSAGQYTQRQIDEILKLFEPKNG